MIIISKITFRDDPYPDNHIIFFAVTENGVDKLAVFKRRGPCWHRHRP